MVRILESDRASFPIRLRRYRAVRPAVLAASLLGGVTPAALAEPRTATPDAGAPATLDLRYRTATLAELARDARQRGGITITVPAAFRNDILQRDASAATWAAGLQELLGAYNYIAMRAPDGKLERIVIQGRQGSGQHARNASPPRSASAALFDVDLAALGKPLPKALAGLHPRAVTPIKLPVERLAKMKPGDTLAVRLGGHAYKLVHDQAQRHDAGDTSWIASVDQDGKAFRAVLTYRADGALTGQINTARGLFQIVQFERQTWVIDLKASGLGTGSLEEDQHSLTGGKLPAPTADANPATRQAPATVDLMVLYTHKAGPEAVLRANHLAAVTQQALTDSGAFVDLRLVRVEHIDYPDDTPNPTALQNLTANRLGPDVKALRRRYGADLVVLLRPFHSSTQGSCGVSWVGGSNGQPLTADAGFSVVSDGFDDRYYCHEYTFAHELGHVFGNVHDPDLSPPGIFPFSYAWAVAGKFATIMSYQVDTAPLVGRFANPMIACTDQGLPCGRKDLADNARTINTTAPIVAAFVPTAAD